MQPGHPLTELAEAPRAPGLEPAVRRPLHHRGLPVAEGIALGHVVLHEPRVEVKQLIADDPKKELQLLDAALNTLRAE